MVVSSQGRVVSGEGRVPGSGGVVVSDGVVGVGGVDVVVVRRERVPRLVRGREM